MAEEIKVKRNTSLFDDEQIMEIYAKDMAKEAAKKTSKKNAALMLKKGKLSIDELAEFFPELAASSRPSPKCYRHQRIN